MSSVKLSALADADQARLYDFLAQYSHEVAARALETILDAIDSLATAPFQGAPVDDRPFLRKLVIDFGASGYLIFHKYNEKTDTVQIARILNQKEDYRTSTVGLDAQAAEGW
jgi:plasmid stabilization system protein ParE